MERPQQVNPVGRMVVPAGRVRESSETCRVPIAGHEHVEEPVIELVREGEIVRAIDITCACGRRYRLRCDYSEGAAG